MKLSFLFIPLVFVIQCCYFFLWSWVYINEDNHRFLDTLTLSIARENVGNNNEEFGNDPLPDWRVTTDCSTFDHFCVSRQLATGKRYRPYPFHFPDQFEIRYKWQELSSISDDWKQLLAKSTPNPYQEFDSVDTSFLPMKVSKSDFKSCMKQTLEVPYEEQLTTVLKRVRRHPLLNMFAFTISDINYAFDMIHEVFQMNDNVVGFEKAFFMVAMDRETVELACQFGYPVIASPGLVSNTNEDLRSRLQSTKFTMSLDLAKLGESFFFYEMDVWFLQSPVNALLEFNGDVIVSGHQNSPQAPNIGVYAARPTKATKEFFKLCLKLLQQQPDTHDQFIFKEVWSLIELKRLQNYDYTFKDEEEWLPEVPKTPTVKHPIMGKTFDWIAFAADVSPIVHEKTLAVHPLCTKPLQTPHGKKMIAKERGAWYGFQDPTGKGGYFRPAKDRRRYLMLDGRVLGGHSLALTNEGRTYGMFHNLHVLKWTIATLVALARRTNRILILPKIAHVNHDQDVGFLWTALDMKSIEGIIDVRETNFAANPKSWSTPTTPFETVARTALGVSWEGDNAKQWKLFAQSPGQNDKDVQAWKLDLDDPFSAWFGLNMSPDIDNAELLLVNPEFAQKNMEAHYCDYYKKKSPIGKEIRDLLRNQLKWCGGDDIGGQLFPRTKLGRTEIVTDKEAWGPFTIADSCKSNASYKLD